MATRIKDFSGAGSYTWICPGGVTAVHILAVGGGGGGGGGYEGFNGVTSARASGGCGGGGAIPTTAFVSVIPGGTYDITIGDGGDGGYGGNAGGNPISGYDGENTIFKLTGPVASLLTALGGGGGRHGVRYSENGTNLFVSIGGSPYNGVTYGTPSSSNASMSFGTNAIYKYDVPPIPYGGGGFFAGNSTNNKAFNGGSSQYNGFGIGGFSGSGGSAGANGTTSGSYLGGIGGGGGGASIGNGGAGGVGGNGNNAGIGGSSTDGLSPTSGYGGGGGGGGGGGSGSTDVGWGSVGGKGAPGFLRIMWVD